jgi:hypothetical protein
LSLHRPGFRHGRRVASFLGTLCFWERFVSGGKSPPQEMTGDGGQSPIMAYDRALPRRRQKQRAVVFNFSDEEHRRLCGSRRIEDIRQRLPPEKIVMERRGGFI